MKKGACIQIKDGCPLHLARLMGKYFIVMGYYSGSVEIEDRTAGDYVRRLVDAKYIRLAHKHKCQNRSRNDKNIYELQATPYVSLVIDELEKAGLLAPDAWENNRIEDVKNICTIIMADRLKEKDNTSGLIDYFNLVFRCTCSGLWS